jgi:xanthine dehydrogenase accessory factor
MLKGFIVHQIKSCGSSCKPTHRRAVRAAIAPSYASNTPFTNRLLRDVAPPDSCWPDRYMETTEPENIAHELIMPFLRRHPACPGGARARPMRNFEPTSDPASAPTDLQFRFDTRGGLPGLLDALAALHARDEVGVLGIVFATAGSTYQKPGALVLLGASGMIHGAISGGCLEPELEERARAVHASRRAQTIEFDTRSDEDLIFGSGTGCRGRIHLLLLPQGPGAPLTRALNRLAAETGVLDVGVSVAGTEVGSGQASLRGETWHWGYDGQPALRMAPESQVGGATAEAPRSNPAATAVTPSPTVALRIAAPLRILLFGAGPETFPLNLFARRIGWALQVVEHRGRWLKFARQANVQQIIEFPPDEAGDVWRKQHVDAVIAMTHNYALDMKHLAICAETELTYIGLLGPAARSEAMLTDLGPEIAARLRKRLRAPVGLGLGGSGPETLALSIAAELQQHFAPPKRQR